MSEIPAGIVTFLFTDVEGSTRLWAADAAATARSLERHDRIIRDAIVSRGGYVFGWAGDHFRGAFVDPKAAVGAAMAAQAALAAEDWENGPALRVRMGLHRGRATQRDGDYFGTVPNTAARLEALASGGQVLLSDAVASVVDVEMLALGQHRLRDVPDPVDISQVGVASFRPLRVIDPSLSTLPLPGTRIIGRNDSVARARHLLESAPIVTLTGTGGCGKTRLAVEVAYQELPSRADGCYFADLSSVSDGSELPAALAAAVRLEFGGSREGALDQVINHLARRDALLVLDNCEHILDDCADFAERLLARGSATALLATTRQRLEVPGERVIAVGSLGLDGEAHAVELFVERATTANPNFRCGDDESDPVRMTVVDICRHLDGMPLAIELAAARIAVLSPSEILDRMADRFRLLSGGRGRQKRRTLQATLDWSYDLLDDDEQQFFRRCGVFVGSFDLPAAVAVSGFDDYDAMDLLGSLVAKSLLAVDEAAANPTARYRLLETIRIYASDHLARTEDVTAARDAHLRWFLSQTVTTDFGEATDLVRAGGLRLDWANIASALEWAVVRERDGAVRDGTPRDGEKTDAGADTAAAIAFGCQGLWESQIPAIEGRRWVEQIADRLEPGPHRDWMHYIRAVLAMQLDDFPVVHDQLDALLAAEGTTPEVRAQAAGLMAFLSCRQYPDRARELASHSHDIATQHQLPDEYLSPGVWAQGCLALYENRVADSLPHFARAYDLLEGMGRHTNHVVMSGLALASAHFLAGEPERALEVVDSREWSSSVWDSSPIVRAIALIDLDRSAEAANHVVEFGVAALRGRLSRMANDALVGFAALAIHREERDHAWLLLQQAASPKTPFTIGLAEGLADRLGHGEELRAIHRGRQKPLSELDASEHLRAELDRIRRAAI
ncbi:MAG: adenylate/guanylate cyclase domain-containing protein [Acidimicrobiales bacterium]